MFNGLMGWAVTAWAWDRSKELLSVIMTQLHSKVESWFLSIECHRFYFVCSRAWH